MKRNNSSRLTPEEIFEREEMIKDGIPYQEIAEYQGVERQAIEQYALRRGLKEEWKKKRYLEERANLQAKRQKNTGQLIGQILSPLERLAIQIQSLVEKKADEEGRFAYDKAIEYLKLCPTTTHDFSFLFDVYSEYERRKKEGEKISYTCIGEKFGMFASSISRILKKVGLRSDRKLKSFHKTTEDERAAVIRGLEKTGLSNADIAYFTGVAKHIVVGIHREGINGRVFDFNGLFLADYGTNGRLTRRAASEIYRFVDRDLKPKTIITRLGVNDRIYAVAIARRESFEADIVGNLRKMHPDRDIQRSYL